MLDWPLGPFHSCYNMIHGSCHCHLLKSPLLVRWFSRYLPTTKWHLLFAKHWIPFLPSMTCTLERFIDRSPKWCLSCMWVRFLSGFSPGGSSPTHTFAVHGDLEVERCCEGIHPVVGNTPLWSLTSAKIGRPPTSHQTKMGVQVKPAESAASMTQAEGRLWIP